MPHELLLVRHEKAEERSADKNDVLRDLTDKGKDEFAEFLDNIRDDLKTDRDVVIWTSPLIRAKQTASILTEAFGLSSAKEKMFIANGDFDALIKEINGLDSDKRVVCVGHEPSLGYWVEELTGSEYSFKKGGMALIQLQKNNPTRGKLLWERNPKVSDKIMNGELVNVQEKKELSLENLLSQVTEENRHHTTEWGEDVGKEKL
jgi:phosphohistidine phosphatase